MLLKIQKVLDVWSIDFTK